jgi:hypothetical protein
MLDSLSVEVLRGDDGGEVERITSLIRSVENCIIVRKNSKEFRNSALPVVRSAVIKSRPFFRKHGRSSKSHYVATALDPRKT